MRKVSVVIAALTLAGMAADARDYPAGGAGGGVEFVLLGTAGGPPAHLDRSQPASLLRVAGRAYLIDAGENAGQQLARAGVSANRLDAAFVTHLHWDHTLGLGYILATGWMLGRGAPLPIVGPPGTAAYVGRELAALRIGEDIFRAATPNNAPLASLYPARDRDVGGPTLVYRDAAVRVTAVSNTHYATLPPTAHSYGVDRSYAYRFDTDRGAVVFTGDTGPSPAVTALARGADILVSEVCDVDSIRAAMRAIMPSAALDAVATHMREEHLGPADVGRMAAAAGVRKLVLTHFVMGSHYDALGFVDRIRPYYKGEIVVGSDLARVALAD